ncbi:hypothetical protein T484DRAFT_1770231 [Baffinella frigidus]|nr:hypothetical protein T484DRAFT_1770231 [Cryptophyta sp. CCMP2293]
MLDNGRDFAQTAPWAGWVARVVLDNEAQWRAGDGFDWGGEDGTRLITSEDADGTSGDPEGNLRVKRDGFDWGGEDGTRLITSEDADGTSGDPEGTSAPLFKDPNEMRFRVRCRFLGAIRSLSLVSVDPPASRWGIHQLAITCLRNQQKSVAITCLRNQRKSVLLPKKLLGGGARGHGGGEDGWVMLNGAR